MKKIIFFSFFLIMLYQAGYGQGFEIRGTVSGVTDGACVWLFDVGIGQKLIDSAVIQDGKFVIRHAKSLDYPISCRLEINNTPLEMNRMKQDLKFYVFWAENSMMTFRCSLDSMQGFWDQENKMGNVQFSGSKTQELYAEYAKMVKAGGKPLKEISLDFIKAHPASVISLSLANSILSLNKADLSLKEINALVGFLDPALEKVPMMARLKQYAASARCVAKGLLYHDIELTTLEGKRVKLSAYVKPGQYNMLVFWASYCSPCRAEIPHLKKIIQQYGQERLNLISISVDTKADAWKKALEKEEMTWVQLCDFAGEQGPVAKDYGVQGVPFCLLLDPEGKMVFGGNIRGQELDSRLGKLLK